MSEGVDLYSRVSPEQKNQKIYIGTLPSYPLKMDIDGLLNSIVGAFLGFGLALVLQAIIVFTMNRRMMDRTIRNIEKEIGDLREYILENLEYDGKIFYDVPVWDTVVSAGNFLYFIKEEYYNDVIHFYSLVNYLNKIEGEEPITLVIEKRREALDCAKNFKNKRDGVTQSIETAEQQ